MPKATFDNLPTEKRQHIIDAAIDEFATHPYAHATLDRIVTAAGISKGSIYHYFSGKSDLYGWLITSYTGERKLAQIGAEIPGPEASIWEVMERAFLAGVHFAVAHPKLTRLGVRFVRDHELHPDLLAISERNAAAGHAWIMALLERARDRGEIRKDVDLTVAAGFLAHAFGMGMLEQLARLLGLSLSAYLDEPDRIQQLTDEQLRDLVRSVTSLFREGAGTRGSA